MFNKELLEGRSKIVKRKDINLLLLFFLQLALLVFIDNEPTILKSTGAERWGKSVNWLLIVRRDQFFK